MFRETISTFIFHAHPTNLFSLGRFAAPALLRGRLPLVLFMLVGDRMLRESEAARLS